MESDDRLYDLMALLGLIVFLYYPSQKSVEAARQILDNILIWSFVVRNLGIFDLKGRAGGHCAHAPRIPGSERWFIDSE